ncbi:YtxH domain-containing protein [Georgenia sp. H159]|uniref:YtxH domain-containing protein n=1 Tax=Georgenia sp. H159 TaxID=3076115 RepID=UPI002D7653E0|nr:YtxH domain-containing protein [Georgenia sp. H159]
MGKLSFFVGAGVGYLLGARAGRQQFEKIKSASQHVWENPRVQTSVQKVEDRVAQVAKEQASAVTDRVAETVKSRIGGSSSSSGSSSSGSSDDGSTMRPTPPQPEI